MWRVARSLCQAAQLHETRCDAVARGFLGTVSATRNGVWAGRTAGGNETVDVAGPRGYHATGAAQSTEFEAVRLDQLQQSHALIVQTRKMGTACLTLNKGATGNLLCTEVRSNDTMRSAVLVPRGGSR
jgi:hypothetical protein